MWAHPRISVNALSSLFQAVPDDIEMWRDLDMDHVGLISPKLEATRWDAARALFADAGLRVSNISIERKAITESIELAANLVRESSCMPRAGEEHRGRSYLGFER